MIATILKVGAANCCYCKRPIEQAFLTQFSDNGHAKWFCSRDLTKQLGMRAEEPHDEADALAVEASGVRS